MLIKVRQVLSYQLTIAELMGIAVILGTPTWSCLSSAQSSPGQSCCFPTSA